ncbi:MAG: hypothetical protein AABY86_03370, partial [Bdellovibrionota bacterium]
PLDRPLHTSCKLPLDLRQNIRGPFLTIDSGSFDIAQGLHSIGLISGFPGLVLEWVWESV